MQRKQYPKHFGKKTIYTYVLTKGISKNKNNGIELFRKIATHILARSAYFEKAFGLDPCTKSLTPSYVAGFFDGEGSLGYYPASRTWYLTVVNSNKQVLDSICSFFSRGKVKKHNANTYRFETRKRKDLIEIAGILLPYSIVKRDKLQEMLDYFDSHEWHSNYKLKQVTDDELRELYHEGFSIRQIAAVYGVKYNPMRERLLKCQVAFRKLGTNQYSLLENNLEPNGKQ